MPQQLKVLHHALNIGVVDRNKLHRVDVDRMRLAAEIQNNLLPDAVGPAQFRPGFGHIVEELGECRIIPFIAGVEASYALELSDTVMRVCRCSTDTLVTRAAVSSTVTNGDFGSSTGWSLSSAAGQTSGISSGKLNLSARAHGAEARCRRQVTTSDAGTEHALRIVVERGPVVFRLGSTSGSADYLPNGQEITLRTGTYSIAFTPTGSYWVEFTNGLATRAIVDSIQVEAAGVLELPTPWATANLPLLRPEQSQDVMFMGCEGVRPMRIERYGETSWGICDYTYNDGPFLPGASADLTLTPSVLEGNGTLTASKAFFTSGHVGALFYLYHNGQMVDTYLAGENVFTPAIEISGITESNFEERKYTYSISGTWSGTLVNQRSFDIPDFGTDPLSGYHDMRRAQTVSTIDITANASYTNDDNEDNIIEYVRIGFKSGEYTSGEANIEIEYEGGGGYGICRVVGYNSSTSVDIEVLTPFKGDAPTKDWLEGAWSGVRGYPAAPALFDGRLWWVGSDDIWFSVSDAYESLDTLQTTTEGDAAAGARSIAIGGRNEGRWLLPLSSLMVGVDARIANVRASSLDEVVTPSNLGVKSSGKIGAAAVSPAELADDRAVFVERAGNRLYEITWSNEKNRYVVNPFSKLTTTPYAPGIKELAVQTLPDQRIWAVIDDGTIVLTTIEPTQQVLCFVTISTASGDAIESVAVVPGLEQDRLYASVRREVDGNTVRYLEKMALDREALAGETICKCVDSFVTFGAGNATISGLEHLEGRTVYAWVDGEPVRDASVTTLGADDAWSAVVTGGEVTLPDAPATGGCVGLRYTARYKSARLSYGAQGVTPMLQRQKLEAVGLLLADYVRDGVKFGTEFDNADNPLQNLPLIDSSTGAVADAIVDGPGPDEDLNSAGGMWGFDNRLCIELMSPKPATIASLVMVISTSNG